MLRGILVIALTGVCSASWGPKPQSPRPQSPRSRRESFGTPRSRGAAPPPDFQQHPAGLSKERIKNNALEEHTKHGNYYSTGEKSSGKAKVYEYKYLGGAGLPSGRNTDDAEMAHLKQEIHFNHGFKTGATHKAAYGDAKGIRERDIVGTGVNPCNPTAATYRKYAPKALSHGAINTDVTMSGSTRRYHTANRKFQSNISPHSGKMAGSDRDGRLGGRTKFLFYNYNSNLIDLHMPKLFFANKIQLERCDLLDPFRKSLTALASPNPLFAPP